VVAQLLKEQRKCWSSCDSAFYSGTGWCITRTDRCRIIWCARAWSRRFRNYLKAEYTISSEEMLIDKAQCDVNSTSNDRSTRRNAGVKHQLWSFKSWCIYSASRVLTNDFFLNLLDMTTTWKSVSESDTIFEGHNRTTELKVLVLAPIWYSARMSFVLLQKCMDVLIHQKSL
jgi:hypothetical protein